MDDYWAAGDQGGNGEDEPMDGTGNGMNHTDVGDEDFDNMVE
jgi:hypothetical protein